MKTIIKRKSQNCQFQKDVDHLAWSKIISKLIQRTIPLDLAYCGKYWRNKLFLLKDKTTQTVYMFLLMPCRLIVSQISTTASKMRK